MANRKIRSVRLIRGVILALAWMAGAPGTALPATPDSATPAPITVRSPDLATLVRRGPRAETPGRPRVAIALSGGGARGLAQIGVLRAFEDARIGIDLVCGVSMGAIIGGLYASGISPDSLEVLARTVNWGELLKNSPPRTRLLFSQKTKAANWFASIPIRNLRPQWPTGATSGQGLYNFLSRLTQGATYRAAADFDQLPLRYRAVATELVSGRRVVFDRGEVAYAMRAAMAFPLAVTPLRKDSLLYADGGLVDPLPVALAAQLSDAPVVAVNTSTGLASADRLTDPYAMANQATSVMTAPLVARALEAADYVCTPDVDMVSNVGFSAIDTLIASGYRAGVQAATAILRDWNVTPADCDLYDGSHQGRLVLAPALTLGDCPPTVAASVAISEEMSACAAQRKIEAAVQSGWWSEASLTPRTGNPHSGSEWVLAAQRPPVLRTIEFQSAQAFDHQTLRDILSLPTGHRYDLPTIANAVRRIVAFYAAHDYTLTDIADVRLRPDGTLVIALDEAPLVSLELTGNHQVKSWVILRNFPLKAGIPYNARLVEQGLSDLQASGLFEQVTTEVLHTDRGPILHLIVTEKTTDAIRFGLHHNLEYQTEVFAEWASVNVLGLGNELIAHAQYAPRRQWFFLRVESDRIFRTYLTSALTGFSERHERRTYSAHRDNGFFTTNRTGAEFFLGQHITRKAQVTLAVTVQNVELRQNTDSAGVHRNLARLTAAAEMDDLDDADFPTTGRRLSARLHWADEFLGGNILYRSFEADGLWAITPRDPLTLTLSAQFATAERRLPIYERFSLGGLDSFMGLNDDEFLGDKLVLGSFAVRYRLFSHSYAAARVDVGTVWDHKAHIDLARDLLIGAGAGLMFDTPLGPLIIMAGATEDDYSKFYFSWGYGF